VRLDTEKLRQLRDLITRKRDLDAELRRVKDAIEVLEAPLLDAFAEEGVQNMKLEDGSTLYLRVQLWARPKKIDGIEEDDAIREIACLGLKEIGLDDFVHETFNIHTLSAYVRELDSQNEPLPEGFDKYIEVTSDSHILCRKG